MSLRETAEEKGLSIGVCLSHDIWKKDEEYRELIKDEFNLLTPENELKWSFLRPEKGEFDFKKADELINFAEENDMDVTGHTLVWHMQNPSWLQKENFDSDEIEKVLEKHIREVVTRYKGRIDTWDVVNEAVNDQGELRDSIWLEKLGKEYIEKAFRYCGKYSDAKLFYNDYGLTYDKDKREKVYEILSNLIEKGVPIDGIGLQMHFIGIRSNPEEVAETIERFQELGLEVRMTEMDLAYKKENRPEDLEQSQANYYGEIFQTCLENGIENLTLWGLRDSDSWINSFQDYNEKYTNRPLIFDSDGDKKKAYREIEKELEKI